MQDDCILVMLGLPQLRILEQKELENRFEVTVMYRWSAVSCSRCGQATNKENDRRIQWKRGRRLRDKVALLRLIKRRFRCLWCSKVFSEPDEVFGPRRRSSYHFRKYLGQVKGASLTFPYNSRNIIFSQIVVIYKLVAVFLKGSIVF